MAAESTRGRVARIGLVAPAQSSLALPQPDTRPTTVFRDEHNAGGFEGGDKAINRVLTPAQFARPGL
ncbi:MAG: hypothetical protein ACR2F8_06030 [Caulobacteraceae bacterium]